MTALTREQVEAWLAGATPGPLIAYHTEDGIGVQRNYSNGDRRDTCKMSNAWTGKNLGDAMLYAASPDLARALIAAWDALEKILALDDNAECCGCGTSDGYSPQQCCGAPFYGIDRAKLIARAALGGDAP